jgi:hypothetical protein
LEHVVYTKDKSEMVRTVRRLGSIFIVFIYYLWVSRAYIVKMNEMPDGIFFERHKFTRSKVLRSKSRSRIEVYQGVCGMYTIVIKSDPGNSIPRASNILIRRQRINGLPARSSNKTIQAQHVHGDLLVKRSRFVSLVKLLRSCS